MKIDKTRKEKLEKFFKKHDKTFKKMAKRI